MQKLNLFANAALILTLILFNNCAPSFQPFQTGFELSSNLRDINGSPIFPPDTNPNTPYKNGPMLESSYRKLTNDELDSKMKYLFGIETSAIQFLGEEQLLPFNTLLDVQVVSNTGATNIEFFAQEMSKIILSQPESSKKIKICSPQNSSDANCFNKILNKLLSESFLNQPDSAMKSLISKELLSLSLESGDFNDAIQGLLMYVLQSPRFLYNELGSGQVSFGIYKLSSIELANKISFLITGAPADSNLIDSALDGELDSPSGISVVIDQLFQTEKATKQLMAFHSMWFGYYNRQLSGSLADNAYKETEMILKNELLDSNSPWSNLLILDHTYVNDSLAEHYGYPKQNKSGFYKLKYNEHAQPRIGILSHATFLSAFPQIGDSALLKEVTICKKTFYVTKLVNLPLMLTLTNLQSQPKAATANKTDI